MINTHTPPDVTGLEFAPADTSSAADAALSQALAFCAVKLQLKGSTSVRDALAQGNRTVRACFDYGLAKYIAQHLGAWDDEIRAVYLYEAEAVPEDIIFGEASPTLIHLIVWARRKTEALNSLLAALNRALVERCADLLHAPQIAHLLDVGIVDDADVDGRKGYGALLVSLHNPPISVWRR